jgi:GT2 family glycosyltransferase
MPVEPETPAFSISILICSRDRRPDLEEVVRDLKAMKTHHSFDIVVVEETDAPRPIEGVHYVSHPVKNLGFPYARNLSVKESSGEILVFVDDDCRIRDGWLDNLVEPFKDPSIVGVQGGVVIPKGSNAVGWAESLLGFPGGGIRRILDAGGLLQPTIELSTLNSAYRRWVIDAAGGFDPRLRLGGEDYLLAKKVCRLGTCLFVPTALVSHRVRGDLPGIWQWFVRRGTAEIAVVRTREYAGANWMAVLKSSLLFKLAILLIAGFMVSFPATSLLLAVLILYVILQYGRFYSTWKNSSGPLSSFLVLPFVKLIMDTATDAGRLKGVFYG